MAYDSIEDIGNVVGGSDLPDDLKETVTQILDNLPADADIEQMSGGGEVPDGTEVAIFSGGGTFTFPAGGTPPTLIIVSGNDPVVLDFGADGPPAGLVVVFGGGSDDMGGGASSKLPVGAQAAGEVAGVTVDGAGGNDNLVGTAARDSITGGLGNDTLVGAAGRDTLAAGTGSDSIDGGAGWDMAKIAGTKASYTSSVVDGKVVLTNGTDTITLDNCEFIEFQDGKAMLAVGTEQQAAVARLYETMLNRTADSDGLNYWLTSQSQGNAMHGIVSNFAKSAEFSAISAGKTTGAFLDGLYQQAFGRAADAAGKAYWEGQINAGLDRGRVAYEFASSTEAKSDFDYIKIVGATHMDIA